jgi:hypothetical protein
MSSGRIGELKAASTTSFSAVKLPEAAFLAIRARPLPVGGNLKTCERNQSFVPAAIGQAAALGKLAFSHSKYTQLGENTNAPEVIGPAPSVAAGDQAQSMSGSPTP